MRKVTELVEDGRAVKDEKVAGDVQAGDAQAGDAQSGDVQAGDVQAEQKEQAAPVNQSEQTNSESIKKRGPGRPPSKPPAPPLPMRGIVNEPRDPMSKMEFVYHDPNTFKNLFTYFKNLKARNILMRYSPNGITYFTRDYRNNCKVRAHFSGKDVNWYYCKETFWLSMNRENAEKVFSSINKTFHKITILFREEDTDNLLIVFRDAEIDKECQYKIMLSNYEEDEDLVMCESQLSEKSLASYPIKFTLTSRQFKKSINDALSHNKVMNIEKIGDRPLHFTATKVNSCVYHEIYKNPTKIKLESLVKSNESFRCPINLDNIKSLASSIVTDDVVIMCRESEDLLVRSVLDSQAIIINTFIKTL